MPDIRVERPLDDILAAVDQIPSTELEIDQGSARVRVGARVVAQIDLRRDEVLVSAPSDAVSALGREFPLVSPGSDRRDLRPRRP